MTSLYHEEEINAHNLKQILSQWESHLTLVRQLQTTVDIPNATIQQWLGEINAAFKARIRSKL